MSAAQSKANVSLVIETMYAVAADPERWEEVIEALDVPAQDGEAPAGTEGVTSLARAAAGAGDRADVGVIVVSGAGGAVACNPAGESLFQHRLGRIEARGLSFLNPSNHEALTQARKRLRETRGRQVIVKFLDEEDEGPHFAYVTPAAALPPGLAATLPQPSPRGEGDIAIVFPALETTDRLWASVRESFGLTPAETRLAARLKDGLSLKEAADDMSVSLNTVRNQLRAVFEKMGLNRQSELVRALTQLGALAQAFEDPAGGARRFSPTIIATERAAAETAPPVQLFKLADGRRLAWRDYGDPGGRPVLVITQDLASSLLPRGTNALARDMGLRMIATERAGAGRSDPHPNFTFASVAADSVALIRHLGIDGLQITTNTDGAAYAMEAAMQLGDSVSRILLASGRPPGLQAERERDQGHTLTLFWRRIYRNPWLSDMIFEMMRLSLSRAQFERYAKAAASAPGDAAYLKAHPELLDFIIDYTRESVEVTARGAAEAIRCAARSDAPDLSVLAAPITLWHGDEDPMNGVDELHAWLGDHVETTRIFPGIGRFLAYKHWAEAMAWLARG
jgi:DNA-binding CsgD family transcriptional regulator/pimeloyl-ACP methyl ester carboxylesterase